MRPVRVTMLLENDLYPQDVRVRDEAHSLRDAGYEVSVVAPRGEGQAAREEVDGVAVERFRLPMDDSGGVRGLLAEYAVAHVALYWRGARALLRGADVLHLHNPPDTLFGPAALARALGRRVVFDQHDLFPDLFVAKFGPSPVVRILKAAQRATIRLSNLVVATNEAQRLLALERGTIDGDMAVVVRNGPPADCLTRDAPLRGGALTDPHLVYVGALESQDGVDEIPALLDTLASEHGLDGLRATIVGFGARQEPLERELERRGLADRVRLTGRVEHAEVLDIVAQADVCLDTAPCNEFNHRTTMVKISEYLALGRPTVSFALEESVRTAGDAVEFAACGDWDDFAGRVAGLAADEDRRLDLGRRARERAEGLIWDRQAVTLLDGYARMTGRGS